jgi:hypothetical protein
VTRDTRQPDGKQPRQGAAPPVATAKWVTLHQKVGWWSIAVFATLGLLLETLHAFKLGLYLDVSNDTRRLMWTLAHAHGTLLGLMHIAFASTIRAESLTARARIATTSALLRAATTLMPTGFFLGGIRFYAGDPGIGIMLVPVGAAALIAAAVIVAREVSASE